MARRKADVKRTLLCATRFWSLGWKARDNSTPTLRAGVRHVVRKQGFTPAEIDKAERELVREGKLEVAGVRSGKTLRLTDKGNRADCKLVKLAPWTDPQYPGAALTGPRRPRRPQTPSPTPEQLAALSAYARKYGNTWKQSLNHAWATGRDAHEPDGHLLRQLRNTFGPSWLAKFRLDGGVALTGPRRPRRLLQAKDLKPGVRFKYRGAEVEVLKPKEKTKDRFGREMDSWWCRRSDTGTEGYVILGPGGVIHAEP